MISTCPHCGRSVASDEWLVTTRLGWVPSVCAAGDGPLCDYRVTEMVRNHPHWYTSCRDGSGNRALVTGPFPTYEAAQSDRARATRLAETRDVRAWFYEWGVASSTEPKPSVFGVPVPEVAKPEPPAADVPEIEEDDTWLAHALGLL